MQSRTDRLLLSTPCTTILPDESEVKEERLCHGCISESFLSEVALRSGKRRKCSYCGTSARSLSLTEVADRVAKALAQHYRRTSEQPDDWQRYQLSDSESSYEWERDGDE